VDGRLIVRWHMHEYGRTSSLGRHHREMLWHGGLRRHNPANRARVPVSKLYS